MNPRSFWKVGAVAMAVLALMVAPVWPQSSNGSVRGIVQDPTTAVIPNVTVTLINTLTGVELKTVSNEVGLYVFPAVIPGPYRITPSIWRWCAASGSFPRLVSARRRSNLTDSR